ncbi:amidase [Colletotrichum graminicola]|uniref:Amidase n=1 Tax=Colletotrichum graminicola (strain M1.001 / M2 / FGSC 10212) TaxID=645133 RepID=E3Q9C5_COLGM|nr:amidase [Colletotrichum graminicola M1.001]EFQ27304.1 amidase [Colletotrichum graminicola M1.001]WDK13084.1 amidase [Colletotrichum graminicola]
MMSAATTWEAIASRHRDKQQQAIPQDWIIPHSKLKELNGTGTANEGRLVSLEAARKSALLTEKELKITESNNARKLLERIHTGELSSEEVTVAFCKRAALAQQLTSCLTEIFFDEGIARARKLDQHLKATGKPIGPLHGLPISLKDSFVVKGHYATVGYVEFLKRPPPTTNSAMVDLLLDAGAVLFCKTNVPQTMMTADSENNIFGRTLNPRKTSLTAGGSTGGEGALVAFRGSVLGVGTDIAGSVRIPSLCCGVYGFKPTADRIPFAGKVYYPFPKLRIPGISPAIGPIANSVDDLVLLMETTLAQRPWEYDASAIDTPWRILDDANKALTIGVLPEDPNYPLHPPVRRALDEAVSSLEAAGHNVVRLPLDPCCGASLGGKLAFTYYGLSFSGLDALESEIGEPLITSVRANVHPFGNEGPLVSPELDTAHRLSEFLNLRDGYADDWRKTWRTYKLDVVLGPGATSTAVPHDTYGVPVYTAMWNVLDYPAGIIPYGFASKDKDPQYQKATAQFEADYDPEACDGAPCAIQVVAPRFRDEECLQAMRIIDRDIQR